MSFFVRFYCGFVVISLFSQYLFAVSNTPSDTFSGNEKKRVVTRLAPQGCFSDVVFDQIMEEQDPHLLYERSRFLKLCPYDSQRKQDQIEALLEKAAQGGHPEALYETGCLFEAACSEHAEAQYGYGLKCLESKEHDIAIFWLKKAATPRCLLPASSFDLQKGTFVTSPRNYCFVPAIHKLKEIFREKKEKIFKENIVKANKGDIIARYYVVPGLAERGRMDEALAFFEKAELAILMYLLRIQNGESLKGIDLNAFKHCVRTSGAYEVVEQLAKDGNGKAAHLLAVSHYSWVAVSAPLGKSKKDELLKSITFFEQTVSQKNLGRKGKRGKKKVKKGKLSEAGQILSATYCFLAKEYDEEDDIEKFESCLEKALEYNHENITALCGLGNFYFAQAQKNKNEELFKKGFNFLKQAADLGDAGACCNIGSCYLRPDLLAWGGMRQEHNGKLVEQYLKVAANNGSEKALRLLCHYYNANGRSRDALTLFEKVFDESADDLFYRGIYYLGAKEEEKALADLNKAKEMGDVMAATKLAQVYLGLKNLPMEDRYHNALGALMYALKNGAVKDDGTFFSVGVERAFKEVLVEFALASQQKGNEKIVNLLQCLLTLLKNKGMCKFVGFVKIPIEKMSGLVSNASGNGSNEGPVQIFV